MFRLGKISVLVSILFMLTVDKTTGQITSSPYSVFGLGYLEGNSIGPSKAMGGTGIAFLSRISLNPQNPASYSGLDSLVSIFELGFFTKYTSFSTRNENQSLVNANLKYVMMGFRIAPWLATGFGFAPYSSVGYNINTTSEIEGTNQEYTKSFEGEGGVNQAFFGTSVRLFKNFSLGINAAYLFGNITNTESSDLFYYSLKEVSYLSNLTFNYGLNYQFKLKEWTYNIGATYGSAKSLRTNNVTTIDTNTGDETIRSRDSQYRIPQSFGAGLAISKEFFQAGLDFELGQWKNVDFTNPLLHTRNSNRYSVGVEFPSQGLNKGTNRMIFYRAGAEYRQSYLIIDGNPINYMGITLGAGLPLKGVLSIVNVSLELGQNGTRKKGLFRENIIQLHIDLALKDMWFMKRRYM